MLHFCILDDNPKNYEIIHNYINSTHQDFFNLDNSIQYREIVRHLQLKGLNIECQDDHSKYEALNWINQNAEGFRLYLDTLKTVYIIWNFIGNDQSDLTYEKYMEIKNKLNQINRKMGNL